MLLARFTDNSDEIQIIYIYIYVYPYTQARINIVDNQSINLPEDIVVGTEPRMKMYIMFIGIMDNGDWRRCSVFRNTVAAG